MDDKSLRIVGIGSAGGGSWQFCQTLAVSSLLAALLAALCGCGHAGAAAKTDPDEAENQPASVAVRAEPAQCRPMTDVVDGLGRCEALPGKIATLTPVIEGSVSAVLAAPATEVKKGQPLVRLDPTLAQADLWEKLTSRAALEASLRLLQSLPRTQEQESHKLAIEAAKVSLAKAEAVVKNLHPLRARGEIPEQQMFEAEAAVAQARLQLRTAESELKVLMLGPRPAAVEEAQAHIAAAAAAVRTAEARLALHTICAPIAGTIDAISCRPGQAVSAGAAIGEIVDSGQLYAAVWLPVGTARRVRPGQPARIGSGSARRLSLRESSDIRRLSLRATFAERKTTSAAFAERKATERSPKDDESLSGKVVSIGRVADPQTGNLLIRVLVDNRGGQLVVGETIRVVIMATRRECVLAVPVAAINDVGEGSVLRVIRHGKAVALQPTLGTRDDGWVEVLGTDLKPGEPVIVEGGYNLPADSAVRVEKP
jgi:RND family efflux transporter MFP subunit